MGTMQILLPQTDADETIEWDPRDKASVENAYRVYARLKRAGYAFFSPDTKRRYSRFNKRYGLILAVPPGFE